MLSFYPVSIKQASNKIRSNKVETIWIGDSLSPNIYESWLIKSPLFFATPSIYGYSSAINDELIRTDLRFAKTIQREYYLDSNVELHTSDSINFDNFLLIVFQHRVRYMHKLFVFFCFFLFLNMSWSVFSKSLLL